MRRKLLEDHEGKVRIFWSFCTPMAAVVMSVRQSRAARKGLCLDFSDSSSSLTAAAALLPLAAENVSNIVGIRPLSLSRALRRSWENVTWNDDF